MKLFILARSIVHMELHIEHEIKGERIEDTIDLDRVRSAKRVDPVFSYEEEKRLQVTWNTGSKSDYIAPRLLGLTP